MATIFNYTFDLIIGENLDGDPAPEFEFSDGTIADDIHKIIGEQADFNDATKEWERVAQIDFNKVASPGAGYSGWAFNYATLATDYGIVGNGGIDGDKVLFIDSSSFSNINKGTLAYYVVLHELGHIVLGGDHVASGTLGSIMTPSPEIPYVLTPSILDIQKAQQLYGASDNNADSTTYTLDGIKITDGTTTWQAVGSNKTHATMWDSGGDADKDTIDMSGYTGTGKGTIDLREGFDASGTQYYSSVGNTFLYLAYGAKIENAIGTKNDDLITGNDAKNELQAGDGKDTLYGGANDDTLVGGADSATTKKDTLYGEGGNDLLLSRYAADKSADSIYGGANNDTLFGGAGDQLFGEAGSDTYFLNKSEATDISNSGSNNFIAWTGNGTLDNRITLSRIENSQIVRNTVVDKIYVKQGAAALVEGAGENDELYWGGTRIQGHVYGQPTGQSNLGANLYLTVSNDNALFLHEICTRNAR